MAAFILLCILVGALVVFPDVRAFVGKGCLLFIIGFVVIVGVVILIAAVAQGFHT
jgi:hypothetical protein